MERLFIQLSDDVLHLNFEKLTLKTGFVVQGHISEWKYNKTGPYSPTTLLTNTLFMFSKVNQ